MLPSYLVRITLRKGAIGVTTPRGRAFRLTRDEKMFVQKLLETKTNFHVFRTDQTKSMGDFMIVDTSSPQAELRKGYFAKGKN